MVQFVRASGLSLSEYTYGANIVDCTFINCTFVDCIFNNVIMNDCVFEHCKLTNINLLDGSFTMNEFKYCSLENLCFKNVFYYTHFHECDFIDVTMEAYLLGYSYGLSLNNLASFRYLFMGQPSQEDYVTICKDIKKVYQERGLLINEGILYLLDPLMPINEAIVKCFECLKKYIEMDFLTKKEQLQFLKKILEIMHETHATTPILLIRLLYTIDQILDLPSNVSLEKIKNNLILIKNTILTFYYTFIDKLSGSIHELLIEEPVVINVVYDKRPDYPLSDILNEIAETTESYVIKTEKGSFIEWIACPANMVVCLEIFLAFLGIVTPIVWDIHKSKAQKKDSPEQILEINNTFVLDNAFAEEVKIVPEITKQAVKPLLQKKINKTIKVIINNQFVTTSNSLGYTNENIKSVKISTGTTS